MSHTQCSVPGCETPVKARGWCKKHYMRWLLNGDTESVVDPHDLCCTCNPTLADPAINYGQCARCKRKPLALMRARP